MAGNSEYLVEITAEDGSATGFDAFDKRAEKSAKEQEKRAKLGAKGDADRLKAREKAEGAALARRSKTGLAAHGRGFAAAERAFGGGAVSSNVGGRFRDVAEAGGHIRSAFAAASTEGAGLAEKFGAMSLAVFGATGAVVGLAVGAAKLAADWVQGAAALGRQSAGIDMSPDQLQRWQGAGERFGVDKASMGAALGGIGGTIHEAMYGRNNEALAALNQLHIGIKRGKDGDVDVDAMAAALADATAKQTPYVQARTAGLFGFQSALPAFRQGSAALRAQGDDFARHGGMVSTDDVGLAGREFTKGVQLRQLGERGLQAAQSAAARGGEGALDAAIAAGRGLADGAPGVGGAIGGAARSFIGAVEHGFTPAVHLFDQGAHEISVSAARLVSYIEGRGRSNLFAVGMAASAFAESGLRADRHQRGGPAQGMWQWEGPRRRLFEHMTGKKLDQASWQDQTDFMLWESDHTERRAARRIAMAKSFAEAGAAVSRYYDRPKDAEGQARYRGQLAEQIGAGTFDHRHQVEVQIHDKRTTAKVSSSTTGQGGAPAVAYASAGGGIGG